MRGPPPTQRTEPQRASENDAPGGAWHALTVFLERAHAAGPLGEDLKLGNPREGRSPVWLQFRWRRLVACPERASRAVNRWKPLPAPRQVTTGVCRADVRAPKLRNTVPQPPRRTTHRLHELERPLMSCSLPSCPRMAVARALWLSSRWIRRNGLFVTSGRPAVDALGHS